MNRQAQIDAPLEVIDAFLERGVEIVEDEVRAGKAVARIFGRAESRLGGALFALYPDPPRPSKTALTRIVRRGQDLFIEATEHFTDELREILLDVVYDEHLFQHRTFRRYIVEPDKKVKEAGRADEFPKWASATGVYRPMPEAVASAFLDQPAPWDGLVWHERFAGYGAGAGEAIRTSVRDSLAAGDDIERATRRVRATLSKFRSRAEMIARTEIQNASHRVAQAFTDKNKKHLLGKQVLVTLDSLTCMECAPYDRATFYYPPGSPSVADMPTYPIHPNCRCRVIPLSRLWQKLGVERPPTSARPSMTGPTEIYDFDTWLRHMADTGRVDIAKRVLGKGYEAWAAGKTLAAFAGLRPVDPKQMLKRTRGTRSKRKSQE